MTFREYLSCAARRSDSPEGDFVLDAIRDPFFPTDVPNIGALVGYLQHRHACEEAVCAARRVWRNYQQHERR